MKFDIHTLIGEATAYDKKQQIEAKRPKSWRRASRNTSSTMPTIISVVCIT